MSAQHIYMSAPLGSIIRYSDGTPKPPARFKRKFAAWENNNGGGRLVRKTPSRYAELFSTRRHHAASG